MEYREATVQKTFKMQVTFITLANLEITLIEFAYRAFLQDLVVFILMDE